MDLVELKRNIFREDKCNKWHADKFPIPYFESFDFKLGEIETSKVVNGELHFNYQHIIPSDLEVYVVKSEAGNFWKENCNEVRPESLREWKHGYSKGFAISEKENILMYWAIVW